MADSLLARYRKDHGAGHGRSAFRSGERRRCARRATISPKCLRCWVFGRCGTTRHAASSTSSRSRWPNSAGPVSTSPCGSPASSGTPSRTWSRCSTTRCARREPRRTRRGELRARARGRRHRRAWRPTPRHHKGFRLQAGHLRRRAAAADRQPQLARRRRPRRGLHRLGRLRVRPRPRRRARRRRHEPAIPPNRGGRQEHRHPRTRHRRLRRLLPVPRRNGGHRAGADGQGARRVHRRQHPAGRRAHPHAVGGDHAGVPGPGGQPAVDDGHASARLQGRVRDGRHRRLPVRLRRHRAG